MSSEQNALVLWDEIHHATVQTSSICLFGVAANIATGTRLGIMCEEYKRCGSDHSEWCGQNRM